MSVDKFFECPNCGCSIFFTFDEKTKMYISTCPWCGIRLEMDKKEYESEDGEWYFVPNED